MAAPQPGRVRIIGGKVRNSRLSVPAVEGLRPTPERVRETLFNWLAPVIEGADCLDLFAGTGALGIEALSRGAASAVLVDADRRAVQGIEANVARLQGIEATAVNASWETFLARPPRPFDLVFLDPPFALDLWQRVGDRLEAGGWLRRTCVDLCRVGPRQRLHPATGLAATSRRHRGGSGVCPLSPPSG